VCVYERDIISGSSTATPLRSLQREQHVYRNDSRYLISHVSHLGYAIA